MLKKSDMHGYQLPCVEHLLINPGAGLFMEMGLGKTVVTLTAADELLNNLMLVTRVLIVAPLKVAESVWMQEAAKWEHLKHLRFSLILGDERKRKEALKQKADIYVINKENLAWLISLSAGRFRFDYVVLDESSFFKNPKAKRFKAMKAVLPALKRLTLLTGTPMPHTFLDLWSQVFLLDQGLRLGDSFDKFRDQYFDKAPYKMFIYDLKELDEDLFGQNYYEKEISAKIGDICISLQQKDYGELPERIDRIIDIPFNSSQRKQYDDFERKQVLKLPDDKNINVVNAAALTNKLLQFAAGAVYDESGQYHEVHTEKLDRLQEILEDAAGHPVMVFYHYKHSLERIKQRLDKCGIKWRMHTGDKETVAWNKGEIDVLLVHPQSAGHGLNLQAGGNIIVWFELNWALDLYQQGNARLIRQGQDKAVIVHHLFVQGTMDYKVWEVLQGRGDRQEAMMRIIKMVVSRHRAAV